MPHGADCAVLRGGAGRRRGRVVADRSRGAGVRRQVKAAKGGRFVKVGVEMRQGMDQGETF